MAATVDFALEDLRPLILKEWPDLDPTVLEGTDGSRDAVIAAISEATGRAQTTTAGILSDLEELAASTGGTEPADEDPLSRIGRAAARAAEEAISRIEERLGPLEGRAQDVAADAEAIGRQVLGRTEEKVREAPLQSLLMALGLGFVLGLLMGTGRGR